MAKAYVFGNIAFVPYPGFAARPTLYVRTHASVALAECPDCGAAKGKPCKGAQGPRVEVHRYRKYEQGYKQLERKLAAGHLLTFEVADG
jgi:hypothetical protein